MTEQRITVAHSPDSDDAFMFYGLASGNVDTGGIVVEQVLSDIETLNRAAFEGKYEVTAVSFHAYAHLVKTYALLPHGASMGDKYGPIVVARPGGPTAVKGTRIAIPGTLTTAYLTLRIYEPDFEYTVVPFDEIGQAVLDGARRRRPADPRRAADVSGRGPGEDRRSGRVVVGAHRRAAAAARRQHHPARPRAGDDREGVEAAPRQHRLRAVAPAGGRRVRAAVRPRPRSHAHRHVRRHVRERPDAVVRRARPEGPRAPDERRVRAAG